MQGMGIVHIQKSRMALDFSTTILWNNFFKIVRGIVSLVNSVLSQIKCDSTKERVVPPFPKKYFPWTVAYEIFRGCDLSRWLNKKEKDIDYLGGGGGPTQERNKKVSAWLLFNKPWGQSVPYCTL